MKLSSFNLKQIHFSNLQVSKEKSWKNFRSLKNLLLKPEFLKMKNLLPLIKSQLIRNTAKLRFL